MTPSADAYWDGLGVAWRAIDPDPKFIAPRLKARLRWQTLFIKGIVIVGIPLSVLGLILGVWTIWIAWPKGVWNFVTRGIGIVAISFMLAFATWVMSTSVRDDTRALADMIDLAILRAEKSLNAIRLGYNACATAAVFGTVGYGIRYYLTRQHAQLAQPLALLALFALALFLYHRHVADNLARFRYLKRALSIQGA